MKTIEEQLETALTAHDLKIATAESCTGGLISEMITRVPGSSAVIECGVCSYSNDIKMKLLNVKQSTIDEFTEVSEQCAKEMAEGVRLLAQADIGISTTGYAGPTGGTKENPVGTVFIGISTKDNVFAYKTNFLDEGCKDRIEVRIQCANSCLRKVLTVISQQ